MRKSFTAILAVFAAAAILFFCFQAQAQSSKTKPKPAATPKSQPGAVKTVLDAKSNPQPGLENEIFAEINSLRSNPAAYIKYLEQMRANFKGNLVALSDGTQLLTSEGGSVVDDAIAFLKNTKPLGTFKLSPGLARAASDHLRDLIGKNITGHKGSDGSWPPNRADRYGFWSLEVKENISYRAKSVRNIVLNMLIDDGNPKREHRKNLLSSNLKFVGLSVGEGQTYGRLCVLVFAGDFTEKRK